MMKTSIVVLIVVCLAVLASVGGRDTVEAQTTAPTIRVSTTTTIGSVDVNETFTLRFRMRRLAGDAGHGGITVSIPALDQRDTRSCRSSYDGPKGSVVTASYTNGASNVCYYARGYQPINKADGSTDVADYLLVESDDTDWPVNGYRTLELDVTPKREGTLTIYYRYWLCGSGYQDCTRFPTIGRVDQQGWNVGIITVPVRNQRPSVARVTPSSKRVRLRPGDTQTFEARATDRNDNISQVEWFVDDRSVSGESLVLTGSISRSFTYRFSNPGTYEVVAEFTDLEGDSDDVDWDVEVTDEINVTVGSNPSGRTISVDGTDRTAPYNTTWDSGTSHTLDVASPQRISGVGDRYVFSRWGHGGSQRQTVRPTSNATYTAYFNLQHFLSTRTEPRGVGIPGGGVWYDHGSTARVGPAPTLEGYRFSHWEKNGQNVGSNTAGVSVRVDAAFLVEAVYTAAVANRPPSVFVVSPLGSPELEPGDSQTFTARATDPDNNISQVEWFVDDRSVSGESLVLTGSINKSFTYRFSNLGTYEVVAEFTDLEGDSDDVDWDVEVTDEINVTVGSNPSGRTISVDGTDRTAPYNTTWDSGTSHTLDVASPQRISGVGDRYVFSRWGHGGSQRQTVRPTSNATYTAYFNLQHFLSTRTEPRGVGIPGGGVWYDHGSTARVGPAPTLEGYRFSHWEKNGQNVGSNAAGVSVRVDAAFLVEAVYTAAVANRPPSVFVVSPLGSPELEPGDSQTFTARATDPDNNITQVEWFVNDRSEGGQSLAPTGLISRSFTYVFSNAGMYRVRATFTDTVGGTDSETWMVKVIPPTLNCFRDLGTLPLGRTSISGSWTGDCASTHQSGSYARFYAFTLTRRTQVQIDLRSAADAYLYLMRGSDSAGLIVDEDDDGGSTGNNSLLDLTLETGTYTVEATTLRSGATGNFSLDIDATAASINCFRNLGTLPTGTTSISGTWNGDCASTHQSGSYARFYAFTLTRRTRVQIDLRSSVDAYLYLLRGADSRGSIVDEDDDGGITGNNSLLDLTLETGTYTVEATTFRSGATGNFSLDIDATAASINCFRNLGTLPTGTTSISGTWNGDCASTHQSGSYARFYAFTLTRRTQVQIDLRSAADAYLYLLRGSDSAGLIVDEDDDGGSTGNNSLLDLTLEAGTYTVEATTFRSGATGNFSLDIDATAASINCFRNLGTLPTGTTSISGTWNGDCASTHQSGSYARFYAFTLTRRTQVQIDLRSAADAYLYLLRGSDSAGLIVDEDNDGGSTGNNSLLDLTLETGTYTVEATTLRSGATGNFSLDIDVDATPPAPPLLCIQTLSGVSPTEPGVSPIEGEWASDCLSEQRTGSYARYYTFTLPATPPGSSTKVTVNLESVVDTYLYLLAGEGSDGRVIASNNNGLNRNTHSQISEFLPGGAYTVEATTNQPAVAGEFFLTVSSITVTVPPPRIDDMRCAPLDALVGEVVDCRPTLSGGEPTRYLWGAIGGNPWSGMGEHFATRWDTPGEKRIVFEVCNDTGCDTGEQSITVDAIAPPPLPSVPLGDPTGLQASAAGPGQVRLTWSPGANADVQWLWSVKADGTGGQYIEASGITSIVTVAGLENGQNYWFTIIAGRNVNGIQEWSQWSQWVNSRVSGAVVQAADDDRAALLALYNATGGSNWANRTSWLSNSPIGQWHGVTTNDAGRVTGLNLQDNNVAGRISPALGMLTELQDLNFQGNELTGSIPTELGNLSNLTHLDLGYNELSGEIPQELGDLSNLTHLFLGFNELSGEIPRELGDLSNLTRLYLFGNRLSGEIPPELGDLSNLTRLILHDNQLTGEIPRELGDLSNLIHLILDENQLTGPIPPELGDLSNLTRLYLFGNRLSGEIPPELGNLSNLTRLFLHDNQLTGPIPSELGNLDNLVWLYLAGNQLTGCVPARFEDALNNDFDDLGRPFCGTAGGAPPASQQAPDLGVTLTISDAGLLYSGATATVTATVFNEGDGAAPGYTLLYYRSQDRRFTNDNVTNSASAGALPPSTNRISDLGFTVPADAGDYYFAACVGGVPGESDTTDNCSDWASASVLHPVTLTASDCRTETTLNTLGAVPDSTEISGTVLARRAVSQANVIWRVIDAFGNTDSSGIEQLGSMTAGETKDFSISTAWGGPNHTCDPELRWVY